MFEQTSITWLLFFLILVMGILIGYVLCKIRGATLFMINNNLAKKLKKEHQEKIEALEENAITNLVCKTQAMVIKEQERQLKLEREGIFKCQNIKKDL